MIFMPPALAQRVVALFALSGVVSIACTAPKQSMPLKLVGLIMPAHNEGPKTAVFRDSVGNVFSGREGDFIEGRYRITRVMADAVEITDTAGRRTTVPLMRGETSTSR